MDAEETHDLLNMIQSGIHPQGYLCGSGVEKGPIDAWAVAKRRHGGH